jgi:putative transposase
VTPTARRQVSETLVTEHQLPVRRACRAVGLSRTAWYRRPADPAERDAAVMTALLAVVEKRTRWGFWKCFDRLRLDGQPWNHKRVHRVYCALRLNLPRRTKRRVPTRLRQPLVAPTTLNSIWALDFMQDALYGGRPFRTLNILDEANREALAIEIGTSIPAARVVRVLEQLILLHGRPAALRLDNGPEFTAECFTAWCDAQGIARLYIQPGKPDQNAFIERFNRTYREEVLDAYLFEVPTEVQRVTDEWLIDYNEQRPHEALGRLPPARFHPRPLPTPAESRNAVCP